METIHIKAKMSKVEQNVSNHFVMFNDNIYDFY